MHITLSTSATPSQIQDHLAKQPHRQQTAFQKKFSLITVPKSGTHHLAKILRMFHINIQRRLFHFKSSAIQNKGSFYTDHSVSILNQFDPDQGYYIGIRDPRDNLISLIRHIKALPFASSEEYSNKSIEEQIDIALDLVPTFSEEILEVFNQQMFFSFELALEVKQAKLKNVMIVKFEDIIRTAAGGPSHTERFKKFTEIARFANLKPSTEKILQVMRESWGNSPTFRKQNPKKVGQWQNVFKPRHIQVFKEKYNHLLLGLGYETDPNWDQHYLNIEEINQDHK